MTSQLPSKNRRDYWVHAVNSKSEKDWTDRSGKWLIFSSIKNLDATWKLIQTETIAGRLGIEAKAAGRLQLS